MVDWLYYSLEVWTEIVGDCQKETKDFDFLETFFSWPLSSLVCLVVAALSPSRSTKVRPPAGARLPWVLALQRAPRPLESTGPHLARVRHRGELRAPFRTDTHRRYFNTHTHAHTHTDDVIYNISVCFMFCLCHGWYVLTLLLINATKQQHPLVLEEGKRQHLCW